ncbi:CBS domain-containing protein [Candidatus Bathyarchaeota archaeon]|nr:CBS domain-containing protein [Candidatus Bathyarchaeota archaeon]
MDAETFRRSLRDKGPFSLKTSSKIRREGDVMHIARTNVVTMAGTTPIYEAVKLMAEKGFRRIPIADPGTKTLEGIVTATDIIDYLGGGEKFNIIQQRFKGNIYAAINEPVRLIMTKKVFSVKTTADISEVVGIMKDKNVGGVPVVDEENRVKAILTERDIAYLFVDKLSGVKVAQIMTKNVATATPKTTILRAEKMMISRGFRRLPIVSNGEVLGIITAMDIIRFFGSGDVFKHLKQGTIKQVLSMPATRIASKDVKTIEAEADIGQAAKIMYERNLGALPVVKGKELVGIVTERDFFKIIE